MLWLNCSNRSSAIAGRRLRTAGKTGQMRRSKKQPKADFVLSLPPTTPAAEVVALAKQRGLKISRAYVYIARAKAGVVGKRGRKQNRSAEAALRSAIAELGLARARQVLAEVERVFR